MNFYRWSDSRGKKLCAEVETRLHRVGSLEITLKEKNIALRSAFRGKGSVLVAARNKNDAWADLEAARSDWLCARRNLRKYNESLTNN